jgi:uncharacterized protein (DUF433 family)
MRTRTSRNKPTPDKAEIVRTPGTCGGRPRIAGHRIRVADVIDIRDTLGQSPEQIARDYQLSLEQVQLAITYYEEHKTEIDDEIRENEEALNRIVNPPIPRRRRSSDSR